MKYWLNIYASENDSVLGGLLIVSGLYMVLWGKSKEMKTTPPLPAAITSLEHQDESEPRSIRVVASSMENVHQQRQ